jgi:hypothetical protein
MTEHSKDQPDRKKQIKELIAQWLKKQAALEKARLLLLRTPGNRISK